jgi:hypothetical protein
MQRINIKGVLKNVKTSGDQQFGDIGRYRLVARLLPSVWNASEYTLWKTYERYKDRLNVRCVRIRGSKKGRVLVTPLLIVVEIPILKISV